MALLLLPLTLAACLSPREQCLAEATRDLTTLRNLIAESEQIIARGFAYRTETVRRPVFTTCETPSGETYRCWDQVVDQRRVATSVDLNAERAKLASMRAKERQLASRAARAQDACRARYPST